MSKKTEIVQVKLPHMTLGAYEQIAKMAGLPTRDVIAVCLAIQVVQAENMAKGTAK